MYTYKKYIEGPLRKQSSLLGGACMMYWSVISFSYLSSNQTHIDKLSPFYKTIQSWNKY